MCGIAGVISFQHNLTDLLPILEQMTDAQAHRGPDGRGLQALQTAAPAIAFGHRRLAIIDLSADGSQPMTDPTHHTTITFNGEIYNYRQLRQQLTTYGHTFHTQTDTEVILKAYAQWGTACPQYLQGIFAFALWDAPQQTLFLARDQLGIKPLYYAVAPDGQTLLFASEVRPILHSGLISPSLDMAGVAGYLAYGSLQEPHTLVRGVYSLPAGSSCPCAVHNGPLHITPTPYWQPTWPTHGSAEVNIEEMYTHLATAVHSQLVADVPVGAFLSGGLDSASIVALMKQATTQVRTFSIIFNETTHDERQYAQLVAQHLGTEHTELLLTAERVRTDLPTALHAFDQPSIDGLNSYYVSQLVRQAGITVALSGVGGDELFGGYNGYGKGLQFERLHRWVQYIPPTLRPSLAQLITAVGHSEKNRRLADLLTTTQPPYFLTRQLFNPTQIGRLLHPSALASLHHGQWGTRHAQLAQQAQPLEAINRQSFLELHTYMLNTLLRDTDQMSMAHALEVRVPLLDHVLVETLAQLAGSSKLSPHTPKPLLTQPLRHLLPPAIIHRPKMGFSFPFDGWLKQLLQQEMQTMLVHQNGLHPLFNPHGTADLWQRFAAGQVNWSRVWSIYMLSHWLTTHHL